MHFLYLFSMSKKLRFIYAPMESGKSASLLMLADSFDRRNVGFICMKPSIDDRDGINVIHSRVGMDRECLGIMPEYDLYAIIKEMNQGLEWILIDESQFLTSSQVEQLRAIVDDFDINIICYGLRTDFQTHLFEGSKRLFELADDIEELNLPCSCGRKALFNARFNENGELVINGEQILIGGEDKYKPLCSKCYTNELKKR